MLSHRIDCPSENTSMTCDMTHTKGLNLVASPQTSDTDVPQESMSSSDDELEWPDAFSFLLGANEDTCCQRVTLDSFQTSSQSGRTWDNSLWSHVPSTTWSRSACSPCSIPEMVVEHHCFSSDDLVDLNEAEGKRRGQELLDILSEGMRANHSLFKQVPPESDGPCLSKQVSVDYCSGSRCFSEDGECANMSHDKGSAESWLMNAMGYKLTGNEDCAAASVQEMVSAAAKDALGDWHSETQQTSDGYLIKLRTPMQWIHDSASHQDLLDQSIACLDQYLWPLFQTQGALSLRQNGDRPQLIVSFPPAGHSEEDLCWNFIHKGHCSKRNCRWIHKRPSTLVIDVELAKHW